MKLSIFHPLIIATLLVIPEVYADEPIDVQLLSSRGEYLKALVTYDHLPKRRITTDAMLAAARSAWALSLPERAIEEFEKALQDPKIPDTERGRIFLSRAIIEFQEERFQVASLYADKAVHFIKIPGPLRAKAWLLSGESLLKLNNFGASAENLQHALDESSQEDEAEIRFQLGDCLMKLNRFSEAEEHLQAVPLNGERIPLAVRKLSEISLALNKPEQAIFWLNKGRSEYPDSFLDSWVDYAMVQAAIGKRDMDMVQRVKDAANQRYAHSDFWLSMLNSASEVALWQDKNGGAK